MANEDKKDFNAMLNDSKDMPKFQTITDQKSIERYGGSKVSMGVVRSTFVISEDGVIEKVMPKVKPDTNAAEILAYLREQERV